MRGAVLVKSLTLALRFRSDETVPDSTGATTTSESERLKYKKTAPFAEASKELVSRVIRKSGQFVRTCCPTSITFQVSSSALDAVGTPDKLKGHPIGRRS